MSDKTLKRARSLSQCTDEDFDSSECTDDFDKQEMLENMTDEEYDEYMFRTWNSGKTKEQLQRERNFTAFLVQEQKITGWTGKPTYTKKVGLIVKNAKKRKMN